MIYRAKTSQRRPVPRSRIHPEKTKKEKILLMIYKQALVSLCIFLFFVGIKIIPLSITTAWIQAIDKQISYQMKWQQVYEVAEQIPAIKTWVEEQWIKEKTVEGSKESLLPEKMEEDVSQDYKEESAGLLKDEKSLDTPELTGNPDQESIEIDEPTEFREGFLEESLGK
ncbi:MAG: hypothetical protein GX962_02630 [Epulopiscium sp.]|nr:hypothetical protein [Candidatus Epulonipiscium sp.]